MSYTYLLDAGEESSAECFSDIPASVLSRLNLTGGKSCSKDSGTESCQGSQSGMMSEPSMASRGEGELTLLQEASPARTSALQATEKESTENTAAFGERW